MADSAQLLADTLRRVPLLNELTPAELASVAVYVGMTRYDAGQIVFSEGERGGDLLVVKEGAVRVVKTALNGRQQLLSIERVGSSLGEVSVFDQGPYSTTAIAMQPTVLLRCPGDRFRDLCRIHPELSIKVIRVLGHRLRHLRRLVEDLSFATVRSRLISHILRLADDRGTRTAHRIEIALDENNEELAARLGTVRELVSRNLGRLHGDGLIVMRKRVIIIPDELALRDELSR